MNLEFISCILYGMKEVFSKRHKKLSSNNNIARESHVFDHKNDKE